LTELERATIEVLEEREDYAQIMMSPLEKGYGTTLGNALRRALLSSVPGAAVTAIQIEGVETEGEKRGDPHHILHEFTTIPGVREDVTEIVLNFKSLIVRSRSPETKILYLKGKGEGEVKASAIEGDADVDILNPDLHLLTLDSNQAEVHIQVYVDQGKGYVSADANKKATFPIGVIPIDSFFSPARQVSYKVVPTAVGQPIEHDRLEMAIWTNRAMGPVDALITAAEILVDRFSIVKDLRSTLVQAQPGGSRLDIPVAALHLSVRSYNALHSVGIETTGDIVAKTPNELLDIKNFGKRSLDEVEQKLQEFGLSLKTEE
jgi:DNA-directed RNA polymerase subunit alpha